MKDKRFDESKLKLQLENLDAYRKAAFALSCACRMSDVLYAYSKKKSISKNEILKEINYIWDSIKEMRVHDAHLNEIERNFLDMIPSEDDLDWDRVSEYADDAISACIFAIRALRDNSSQDAAWAGKRAYDAADRLAQYDLESTDFSLKEEQRILSHSAIQNELEMQNFDIIELTDSQDFAETLEKLQISSLRQSFMAGS